MRSLLDAGARIAFGSDFPIEDPSPLLGLYAAIARKDASGAPAGGWYPAERMSPYEALRGFTVGAALASFAEREQGRIMPGMRADLTALDVDPLEDPPERLLAGRTLLTVVGGKTAFSA
jgi:predicted amidohydrolase YtcJ